MKKLQACEIQLDAKHFGCRVFAVTCKCFKNPNDYECKSYFGYSNLSLSPTPRKTKKITKEKSLQHNKFPSSKDKIKTYRLSLPDNSLRKNLKINSQTFRTRFKNTRTKLC